MAHLSDGTLRRMYDEPVAVAATAREHFNGCVRCQDRFGEVASTAREVQAALMVPAVAVEPGAALRAVSARLERPRPAWLRGLRIRRPVLVAGLAAAMVAGVAATAIALNMITVFEPTHTQAIPITAASFQGFPDLSSWGTVKVLMQPELREEDSAAAAARDSGLAVIAPRLPAGVSVPAPQYAVVTQASGSFTFSAARAAEAAQRSGKTAPPLPAGLDGSTLSATGGPGEVAVYGTIDPKQISSGNLPALVVGEAKAPVVSSSGATVRQIEDAVLAQPGVSPELAAEIRAIGDPTSTLPIPFPVDRAQAHDFTLPNGTPATYIGDNTRIYAGVVFVRRGVVYAVAGSLTQDQLVAIATGL